MLKQVGVVIFSAAFLVPGLAAAETLPSTAKKATMDEFKAFADGKTVEVVIYDLEVPVTATLVWDWKNKRIKGTGLVNEKDKIKVKTKLSFREDMACSDQDGKPNCHQIYIDGNKFYEVREDGKVHATSTLKE